MPLVILITVFSHFSDPPENCVFKNRQSPTILFADMYSTTYLLLRLCCWIIILAFVTPLVITLFVHCLTSCWASQDLVTLVFRIWNFKTKKLFLLLILLGFVRCSFYPRSLTSEMVSREVISIAQFASYSRNLRFMLKNHEYGLIKRSLLISSGSVEE